MQFVFKALTCTPHKTAHLYKFQNNVHAPLIPITEDAACQVSCNLFSDVDWYVNISANNAAGFLILPEINSVQPNPSESLQKIP